MAQRTYPSYWLYKDIRGEWRWTYEAVNGETIAVSSEGYKRRADAQRGIDIMKASTNSLGSGPNNGISMVGRSCFTG